MLDGCVLLRLVDLVVWQVVGEGWYYDVVECCGILYVCIVLVDICQVFVLQLDLFVIVVFVDDVFLVVLVLGCVLFFDSLLVVNCLVEEFGYELEKVFDDDLVIWFCMVCNQVVKIGVYEWVIGFGECKLIDGIELVLCND